MKVRVSAPGNLFFLGEHAVVYNRPSINTAVNKKTTVTLLERNDDKIIVTSDVFGRAEAFFDQGVVKEKMEKEELDPLFKVIDYIAKNFGINNGFELKIESDIPIKSGMSSSTAVLVAIFKAITELYGHGVDLNEYWNHLYQFQVHIHGGKASGSEIITSSLGGYHIIQKIKEGETDKITWESLGEHRFSIVVGDTKVVSPTALTVGYHVPSLINRDSELVFNTFDQIAELVSKAKNAIANDDAETMGKLMNQNQLMLKKLRLSHPKLDECIEQALNAGALGAKLSGSGWGGVMFALTRPEDQERVAKAMEETGVKTHKTEIGVKGVEVEAHT